MTSNKIQGAKMHTNIEPIIDAVWGNDGDDTLVGVMVDQNRVRINNVKYSRSIIDKLTEMAATMDAERVRSLLVTLKDIQAGETVTMKEMTESIELMKINELRNELKFLVLNGFVKKLGSVYINNGASGPRYRLTDRGIDYLREQE